MSMQLTSLTVGKQTYPLRTAILSFEAESTKNKDATKVGVGAGLGAVIGAIAGGGKGAAIGAAACPTRFSQRRAAISGVSLGMSLRKTCSSR